MLYSLFTFNSSWRISSVVSGSRADVASSQMRMSGDVAKARAMPTLCFCPLIGFPDIYLPYPLNQRTSAFPLLFDLVLLLANRQA